MRRRWSEENTPAPHIIQAPAAEELQSLSVMRQSAKTMCYRVQEHGEVHHQWSERVPSRGLQRPTALIELLIMTNLKLDAS